FPINGCHLVNEMTHPFITFMIPFPRRTENNFQLVVFGTELHVTTEFIRQFKQFSTVDLLTAIFVDEQLNLFILLMDRCNALSLGEHFQVRHCKCSPSERDRKSTRLNSSHVSISYAVFCLKKKSNTV